MIKTDSTVWRIILIGLLALLSHGAVIMVKSIGHYILTTKSSTSHAKLRSVASLTKSFLVFIFYFGAVGLILRELGVSLTAYLASASVIGLAVGFGSQGLVQDVVMGLTLVLSNLIDVGDMVEIGGQTGIIKSLGMRFVTLENAMGAEVFIPNRSIINVINYPRGYVRCLVDVILPPDPELRDKISAIAQDVSNSFIEQFPGLIIRSHSFEGIKKTPMGKEFFRVKFRIWPGRGTAIETSFKQELIQRIKTTDATYSDWMVAVYYEVEKNPEKSPVLPGIKRARSTK